MTVALHFLPAEAILPLLLHIAPAPPFGGHWERVFDIVHERLDDFRKFVEAIAGIASE